MNFDLNYLQTGETELDEIFWGISMSKSVFSDIETIKTYITTMLLTIMGLIHDYAK